MSDVSAQGAAKNKSKISIKTFLPRTLLGRSLMILITPVILIQVVMGLLEL